MPLYGPPALPLTGGTLTGGLTVALGTITTDQQNESWTATWNNAGVTFTALKLNVTDTASNAASLLLDLQKAGVSQFKVNKSGTVTGVNFLGAVAGSGFADAAGVLGSQTIDIHYNTTGVNQATGRVYGWSDNSANLNTIATSISRISDGVVGIGTGTSGSVAGTLHAASFVALPATAVGAGANTQAFVKGSSTANLGIYYGTGDPGFSAGKGSLYVKTDATTTTTRLWVNTDGSTAWTFFTSNA